MQSSLLFPKEYKFSDEGNDWLSWHSEKLHNPKKYARKKIKRQFKSSIRIMCKVNKYRKLTPQEKFKSHIASIAKMKKWKVDNRDKVNVSRSLLNQAYPWKTAARRAKASAKKKNLPYDLTPEYLATIYTGKCALSGITFEFTKGRINVRSCSLDKIDPKLGYVQGNVRFILYCINAFKSDSTDNHMREVIEALMQNKFLLSVC